MEFAEMNNWMAIGLTLLLILDNVATKVSSNAAPQLSTDSTDPQLVAVEGMSVRLNCPISAGTDLLVEWTKDDQTIRRDWERFTISERMLKINDVTSDDAGHYVCKAINGYGLATFEYQLTVVSDEDDLESQVRSAENNGPEREPYFIERGAMDEQKIKRRPAGSSVRFRCGVGGFPKPYVEWFYNGGQLLNGHDKKISDFTLDLIDLREQGSGNYTCRATSRLGRISYTFTLEVFARVSEPVIGDPNPVTKTIAYGGIVVFQCRVFSETQPSIQWLKRVDDRRDLGKHNNTMVFDSEEFYRMPRSADGAVVEHSDGSYLNKLIIQGATPKDSGTYLCVGANNKGYSLKRSFLMVKSVPSPRMNMSKGQMEEVASYKSHSEAAGGFSLAAVVIIVVLPTVIFALLALCAVHFLRKAYAPQTPNSATRTATAVRGACNGGNQSLQRAQQDHPPLLHHAQQREQRTPQQSSSSSAAKQYGNRATIGTYQQHPSTYYPYDEVSTQDSCGAKYIV